MLNLTRFIITYIMSKSDLKFLQRMRNYQSISCIKELFKIQRFLCIYMVIIRNLDGNSSASNMERTLNRFLIIIISLRFVRTKPRKYSCKFFLRIYRPRCKFVISQEQFLQMLEENEYLSFKIMLVSSKLVLFLHHG